MEIATDTHAAGGLLLLSLHDYRHDIETHRPDRCGARATQCNAFSTIIVREKLTTRELWHTRQYHDAEVFQQFCFFAEKLRNH